MVRKVAYMLLVLVGDVDGMNDGGDVVGDVVGAWVCSRTGARSCG